MCILPSVDDKIIKNAVEKVFKELSGVEKDGDGKADTISTAELYAGVLLVYK